MKHDSQFLEAKQHTIINGITVQKSNLKGLFTYQRDNIIPSLETALSSLTLSCLP